VTITQHRTRVVVSDDGPGMSQAEMDRAFRRFAASGTGGSGLGLAIVHRLASSSGGSVRLSQTQGGGLTVAVDFPLADQARGADQLGTPRARRVLLNKSL
jgi:signal transduction histidine kinase